MGSDLNFYSLASFNQYNHSSVIEHILKSGHAHEKYFFWKMYNKNVY
jgi:hypothetical protein